EVVRARLLMQHAVQEQLHVAFVRGIRLAVWIHKGEVRDRHGHVEVVGNRRTGSGDTIVIVGVPTAGPWVATTRTDAKTSGVSGVPLSWTSCRRIVCGPDSSGSENGSTRVRSREYTPSTYTSTWPSVGPPTWPTRPGCTSMKLATAKLTITGVP